MLLGAVVLLTIILDQLSKAYVVAHLDLYESWMPLDWVEPYFRFTHIRNTGAAFGIFPEGNMIFSIIAVIVSMMIVYYYRQLPSEAWLVRMALGLQLGGALGNLVDRIRQGYVVDFLHLEHWPVSNVADISIVMGVVLLTYEVFREERRMNKQKAEAVNQDNSVDSSEEEALC